MLVGVQLGLDDGAVTTLGPGDIVGRMPSAALVLDDPRISEAHAMVSLRGAELQLLALRGMFAVNGEPSKKVVLSVGQHIAFAAGVQVDVLAVHLPAALVALEGEGLPKQVLSASNSLFIGPPPRVVPGAAVDAQAWIWSLGERWRLRVGTSPAVDLLSDEAFVVAGRRFALASVRVERASTDATLADGRVGEPLTLVAGWDTFRIEAAGRPPLVIGGISARLLSLLAEVDTSLSWEGLAAELWPAEGDRLALRRRLDVSLSRLRGRLRDGGVRTDLVKASGSGHYELVRYPGDVVTDRT